jgi:hypothetical protein
LKRQYGPSDRLQTLKPKARWKFRWLKFLRLAAAVILVVFLLEAGWLLVVNLFQKVVIANWGSIEKGCWAEGLYLRKEKMVTASDTGELIPEIKSGERIPRDEIIALIDTGNVFLGKNREVTAGQIAAYKKLQQYLREESALHMDLQRINYDVARRSGHRGKIDSSPDLILLKQEKEEVLRTIQSIRSISARYRRELEPSFAGLTIVAVTEPGYFSFEYDGYETTLNPGAFSGLKRDDFGRKYLLRRPGNHVKKGEILGKLIAPFQQMIVFKVDLRNMTIPKKGDIWRVKTKYGWKNAPVSAYKPLSATEGIVGVDVQTAEIEQLTSRTAKLFVVYQQITGVIVPVQTIFRHDGHAFVRIVKGDGYREKMVNIIATDGGRAVITGIETGTMIISR